MDLAKLGRIAGVAGIALGVFAVLFRGILSIQLLPLGVSSSQAVAIILAFMIFTFGIAGIGLLTWLAQPYPRGRTRNADGPIPKAPIGILAALFVLVLFAAVYVSLNPPGAIVPSTPNRPTETFNVCMGNGGGASCNGPNITSYTCAQYKAIGGGSAQTYSTLGQRFCKYTDNGTKRVSPYKVIVTYDVGGGECGWTNFKVTCNP